MEFLPRHEFNSCVRRYGGDRRSRGFWCRDQFLCLAFAPLTFRESLRDIETCLRAVRTKFYHAGFRGRISRSTLADANREHDWQIYTDFAKVLIVHTCELYAHDTLAVALEQTVYALDSTTIDLCWSLFPWARFRRRKGAVKLHTLLDLRGNIPCFIRITHGKTHDVTVLDHLPVEPGAFSVMDRGYIDFARLYTPTARAAFFVTRAKGDVGGTIEGTDGNASVIARGGFQGTVTAGLDAIVATGDAITSATFTAGRDANVSSHDGVTSTNISAFHNASLWAKGVISSSQVLASYFASGSYQPGSASVSSLSPEFINVTAKARDNVAMYSGGNMMSATAETRRGTITASALTQLDGTFTAGSGVTLVSLGDITSGTSVTAGTYQAATVDVFAGQSVDGSYTVTGSVIASAMQDVKGTFNITTGGATLFAGFDADASMTADANVVVNAGREIKNNLTSNNGEVTAGISGATGGGAMSATIQAQTKATITNLMGDVTGGITVNAGGADITADGQLSSVVTTTNGGIVSRLTGQISSGNLTANLAAIDLATLQDIASAVNANAGTTLTAWAGTVIGGTLTATGDVSAVSQTENVTGNVTSNAGNVSVSALKTVSGAIAANQKTPPSTSLLKKSGFVVCERRDQVASAVCENVISNFGKTG